MLSVFRLVPDQTRRTPVAGIAPHGAVPYRETVPCWHHNSQGSCRALSALRILQLRGEREEGKHNVPGER